MERGPEDARPESEEPAPGRTAPPRGDRRADISSASRPARPEHVARDLLGGGRQAVIRHEGRRYLLSLTRANKLILTRDDDTGA